MTWPPATRKDHERFCEVEGWTGRTGTHHVTYELGLPDGRVLRTRISHPVDRTGFGQRLWAHVLRDQLDVSEEEFRAGVRDGSVPVRSRSAAPQAALPADLVHLLRTRVRLTDAEVAAMSREEALARLRRYWTEGS